MTYRGEHLAGYAGEKVVIRYNPQDITTIWVYQYENGKDLFLARAHAQDLETESLSVAEAKAISRRLRRQGRLITNQAILEEVRWRDGQASQGLIPAQPPVPVPSAQLVLPEVEPVSTSKSQVNTEIEEEDEDEIAYDDIPDVEVRYYEDAPGYWRLGR